MPLNGSFDAVKCDIWYPATCHRRSKHWDE